MCDIGSISSLFSDIYVCIYVYVMYCLARGHLNHWLEAYIPHARSKSSRVVFIWNISRVAWGIWNLLFSWRAETVSSNTLIYIKNNTSIHSKLDTLCSIKSLEHETAGALNHITMMYSVTFCRSSTIKQRCSLWNGGLHSNTDTVHTLTHICIEMLTCSSKSYIFCVIIMPHKHTRGCGFRCFGAIVIPFIQYMVMIINSMGHLSSSVAMLPWSL